MWPLSINYPCLVSILLVKYTVKWKMFALFMIKTKLCSLDKFQVLINVFFLATYFFFYIWIIVHFHCIWIWVFLLFLILRFLIFSDLHSHFCHFDFYLHWKITTFKSQDLLKISLKVYYIYHMDMQWKIYLLKI